MFREEQILLLKQFVSLCKGNPAILHTPELEFFKEWLLSLHAKLPPAPENPKASHQEDEEAEEISTPGAKSEPKQEHHDKDTSSEESDAEIESAESDVELEQLGGLLTDEVDVIQEMGDASIEVTDDMVADSNEKRSEAMAALSDGNIEEAIRCFSEAIKKNPHAANLYAKRASVFIQAGKPSAAIRDCEKALSINKDSAQPYKWRGRAYRLLGKYEEAWHDFQLACKLDFDDTTYEWQKEVEPNAKKLAEHRRKCERKHAEFERRQQVKEAQRRRKKAQKEYEEAKKRPPTGGAGGFPGGMPGGFPGGMPGGFPGGMPGGFPGGMPGGFPGGFPGGMPGGGGAAGGMPDIGSLFSDPELMAAMQDPEVMAAFQDVSKNPANMHKYESNPKVKRVIEKLQSKLGGAAKH